MVMAGVSYQPGTILRETIHSIRNILGDSLDDLTVERVVIGVFYTGVKLSNGQGGLCFTPIKAIPGAVCCPSSARAMPASGELRGRKATAFLEGMFADQALRRALGIAVLNALSATCWQVRPPMNYTLKTGANALDQVIIPGEGQVVVVGALAPFLKVLKRQDCRFTILELDSATLKKDELPFYRPPEDAPEVIPWADLLIITGTTLINDTLEGLLSVVKPGAQVVVVGPTASMLPDAFFRRGVNLLGGTLVTKPDELLDVLAEAGSGYHFYGRAAEMMVLRLSDHGGTI
ncbi:hypothetical protein MOLA_04370 [Moorella thermoacetica]|uniref:DUF364 domain-containing protein n=1 Tax=Neomoorella thermoacetica TaxID=1525 RepID=UPI0011E61135|nr:DUF364 domain-containing protein [Moorella thermoacetica]TYL12427.1 hypothetical protein MOLA_04370 [Moorella thermoacetica]